MTEFTYQLYKEEDKIITGSGRVVIVTCWTDAKAVASYFDKAAYAAIGNLYFPNRGLDLLVRHLLLNNHVTDLVLLTDWSRLSEKAGAENAVHNFFAYGVEEGERSGKDVWKVKAVPNAYIEKDIELEWINQLRASIKLHCLSKYDCEGAVSKIPNKIAALPKLLDSAPYRQPCPAPPLELPQVSSLSAPLSGQVIEASSIIDLWCEALFRVVKGGASTTNTKELRNITLILKDSATFSSQLDSLPSYIEQSKDYILNYSKDLIADEAPVSGTYTYGSRIRKSLDYVIDKLKNEPNTRQAVMSIWENESDAYSSSPPCLNNLQFRVNDGRLDLSVLFRSNDCYSALVSNLFGMKYLQQYVADEIDAEIGLIGYHVSSSLHVYEDCLERAEYPITQYLTKGFGFKEDGCGSFIIDITDTIKVDYINNEGELQVTLESNDVRQLLKKIDRQFPWLSNSHAMYLGKELQRAKQCLDSNLSFIQD